MTTEQGKYPESFLKIAFQNSKNTDADECRQRVASEVGTYADLSKALLDDNPTAERIRWASNIGQPLHTQWVVGDAETAEASFLAINQRAVVISDTEKNMIIGRRKPNVIAARALVRSATGYEYWSKFDQETRDAIKKKARLIYDILFEPENADLSRSIEMPVAGKPYSADALRISLDLINFANDLRTSKALEAVEDDADGSKTKRYLDKVYGVVKYISGGSAASLGLHPSVYFWGATGKHHPSAFLAVVSFIQHLNSSEKLVDFCFYRAEFEEFLVDNQNIIKHILGKYGGWTKSAPSVFEMYKMIFEGIKGGRSHKDIMAGIISDRRFSGLSGAVEIENAPNRRITRETKNAIRRRELLYKAIRCSICHARLPSSAFSDDHVKGVQDGGRGDEDNAQLTHPYCNHGFKEYLVSSGKALPPPIR